MLLLAGILAGGFCVWFAIKIGFYETWAMLFNIVIAIFTALFLAGPIINFLPEDAINIPGRDALILLVIAAGTFLILYGITYILFTSQFKVILPKIFDILLAGLLGFFGGFLVLSFIALIIILTPIGAYTGMDDTSIEYNMSSSYWLFDGIHSIVSTKDNEITTEQIIKQLLNKSQPDTQNKNSQQAEPDKPITSKET
jgi:hypothetical protein